MAIAESIGKLAAGLLAIIHNRIELATVEVEEELLRIFSSLLLALVALFCLGVAVSIAVLLLILLFWETHQIGVLMTLLVVFSFSGIMIGLGVRKRYRDKPRLLNTSLGEIKKDIDSISPPSSAR
jgi:uncharacterized membrane protein YqjE